MKNMNPCDTCLTTAMIIVHGYVSFFRPGFDDRSHGRVQVNCRLWPCLGSIGRGWRTLGPSSLAVSR